MHIYPNTVYLDYTKISSLKLFCLAVINKRLWSSLILWKGSFDWNVKVWQSHFLILIAWLFSCKHPTLLNWFQSEEFSKQQQADLEGKGQELSSDLYFMKQFVGNACGTVALMHAVANIADRWGSNSSEIVLINDF